MRRNILALTMLLASILFFAFASPMLAQQGPIWTHTASSCTIDEADLVVFRTQQEEVLFRPNSNDTTVVMRCNVTNPDDFAISPGWDRLGITYRDPDGMGLNTRVRAWLYRVDKAAGGQFLLVSFNSNTVADMTEHYSSICFAPSVGDFLNFYYHVVVEIYRANANAGNVKVCGVDLYYCD